MVTTNVVEKLATQDCIEMLGLAVKVMDILAFETRWFTMISLACESLSRESLTELMHWLRLVSRDMMALKMGAQDTITSTYVQNSIITIITALVHASIVRGCY